MERIQNALEDFGLKLRKREWMQTCFGMRAILSEENFSYRFRN